MIAHLSLFVGTRVPATAAVSAVALGRGVAVPRLLQADLEPAS